MTLHRSCARSLTFENFVLFAQVTIGPWIDNGFYYDFDMQGDVLDQVIVSTP